MPKSPEPPTGPAENPLPTTSPLSARGRDWFRSGTATVTGLVAFGATAGTGVVAAQIGNDAAAAARHDQQVQHEQALKQAQARAEALAKIPVVVHHKRAHKVITQVTVRRVVSGSPSSGGSVRSWSGGSSSHSSGGSSGGGGGGGGSAPPPPPPPPPPPAPSSGS